MNKPKSDYKFLILGVFAVFLIKLGFSFLPSFGFDMGSWLGWAGRLSSLGLAKFYSESDWTQYTPGYLYFLWAIGKLGWITELAVKIPVTIADIGIGVLIWNLVRKVNYKLAFFSFFIYTLNPVVVLDGSIWGQIDGLLTLFLFLSAYYLIDKKNFIASIFFWSIAFLIKPQSIAILPAILFGIFAYKIKFKEIVSAGLVSGATIIFLSWPFFPENPIFGLPQQIIKMSQYYSYISVFAFNIWTWFGSWNMSTSDKTLFLNISLSAWGTIFYISSIIFALFIFRKKLNIKANYYLLFAVLSLCFFLFPTKVHERYVFPFFAFLLTAAGLSKSGNIFGVYIITSAASFLNIYFPYSYFYPDQLKSEFLYNLSGSLAKIIGLVFLASYFVILFLDRIPKIKLPKLHREEVMKMRFPKIKLPPKQAKLILLAILIFSFASRIFNLSSPSNEYFDEVYHAFTARVILNGGVEAWEWWNTPPAGFAYEWTHPPLAKLGMVMGMKIFGENSLGWRLPAAVLGTGSVFVIYLIAKKLFEDEALGILSAGVFSLEGLPLVMSRIGMNDSYLLFFVLLAIYFFLENRDFWSAVSFGLAISSKWSAVWVVPILGILWLKRTFKDRVFKVSVFWFLFLPFVIYILTYLPMFLTGHDFSVWWEMQKQMWWYHTGLKATHPYTSPWWSWPFDLRPVYLYTSDEIGGKVSRIYAFGNPAVFWLGILSLILSAFYSFVEKNKKLGLVIFSYLIFFAPWAASPRIMFFYHYLPSIPFLAIASGYVLRRNPKLIAYFLVLSALLFIYFYPHWAGLEIPVWLDKSYYWLRSWR